MTAPLTGLLVGELPLRVLRPHLHGPLILHCRCGHARPTDKTTAVIQMASHALACRRGAQQAAADPRPLAGEQPVRIIRLHRPGARPRLALVCVCGAEATWWRWGSHSESRSLKTHLRRPSMGADLSLDGLGVLLRHCGTCETALAWSPARNRLPGGLPAGTLPA